MKLFSNFKRNRKAQMADIIGVLVVIVSAILALALGRYVFVKFYQGVEDMGLQGVNNTKALESMHGMGVMFGMIDNMMIFIVVGLTIGLIMSSFLLPAHPIFLAGNIIGIFVIVFLAAALSNMYNDILTTPDISATLQNVSLPGYTNMHSSSWIMLKLPWICVFITFISTIVMFAKGREENV